MTTGNEPINSIPDLNNHPSPWYGLTKHEYYAGLAMQGLLSNPEWMTEFKGEKYLMRSDILAEVACKQADAMIKFLNKP